MKRAALSIAILFTLGFIQCTQFERDNPYDPNGTTYSNSIIVVTNEFGTNVLPRVVFTAPTNGQVFSQGMDSITLTVTARDYDGSISQVEFYEGTSFQNFIDSTTIAPFSVEWSRMGTETGTYTFVAIVYDDMMGTNVSTPISIEIQ